MSLNFEIDKNGECVGPVTSRQLADALNMLACFLRAAESLAEAVGDEAASRLGGEAREAQAMANRLREAKALLLREDQ